MVDYLVPFIDCSKKGRVEHIRRYISRHSERTITAEEIANVFGVCADTIYRYAKECLISLHRVPTRVPERDRLIRKGLSGKKIADILCLSENSVRAYIIRTGQHESWREARKEVTYYRRHK